MFLDRRRMHAFHDDILRSGMCFDMRVHVDRRGRSDDDALQQDETRWWLSTEPFPLSGTPRAQELQHMPPALLFAIAAFRLRGGRR